MDRNEAIEVLRKYSPKDAVLREALETAVPELKEPSCFHGGPCTNPQMDCINCPRKGYTGGINVTTSTNGKE